MTESKNTRRRRVDEDLTLEEHVTKRREQLVAERNDIPRMQAIIEETEKKATKMTAAWQCRLRRDLEFDISEISKEIDIRASMSREHAFEANVVTYLRTYHSAGASSSGMQLPTKKSDSIAAYVRHSDLSAEHKRNIRDEYLAYVHNSPLKVAMAARDECPRCEEKLLLCSKRSIMSCPECGYSVTYLDATSSSTAFDEVIDFGQYSYKRVNHYLMWLALVQGKGCA